MGRWQNFWWRHGNSVKEFFSIIGIAILIIAIVAGPIITITYVTEKHACEGQGEMMEVEYDYGYPNGCMWKIDSQWIPDDNYILKEGKL